METIDYIAQRYNLDLEQPSPIEIPNAGRNDLAALFAELGFRRGAEIGVEEGLYSEVLCKANPNLLLYCIDAWEAYPGYRDHVGVEKLQAFYQAAANRLAPYNARLMRAFSMDAVHRFHDGELDFVYIDANHELPWVIDDIYWWDRKVRVGGIVAGHDYYRSKRLYTKCHVKWAVDCFTAAFRIRPWFLWGSQAKVPGEVRDTSRSWMWVKGPMNYGEYMRMARE